MGTYLIYAEIMKFFLNGAEFRESDNNLRMNWAQFKDPFSHMCLSGAEVACWSLMQELAGSSPFTAMTNIFVIQFSEFSENI